MSETSRQGRENAIPAKPTAYINFARGDPRDQATWRTEVIKPPEGGRPRDEPRRAQGKQLRGLN